MRGRHVARAGEIARGHSRVGALVAGMAAALVLFAGAAMGQGPDPDRYIVKFAEQGNSQAARQAIGRAGGSVLLEVPAVNAVAARIPAQALQGLRNNPNIELIEQDSPRFPMAQVTPYGISMVQGDLVSPELGGPIKICVIDSGFDLGHEDFSGATVDGTNVARSGGGTNVWYTDSCGHGTHVAGTIMAQNNSLGVVGVTPKVSLHIVKVFDGESCGWTYASNTINAANICANAGAKVINMSLGCVDSGRGGPFGCASSTENTGFQNLYDAGILSVASAGNAGTTQKSYPASYASVISVAAIDENMVAADFSQRNDAVELSAPGVAVLSTVPWVDANSLSSGGSTWDGGYIDGAARTGGTTGLIADGGKCTSANSAWQDRLVLCQRGDVSFADKVNNVRLGGGRAAVVYNNLANDSSCGPFLGTLQGTSTIPAISLSCEQGAAALGRVNQSGTVVSSIDHNASGYEAWNGTSMASPHVAGVAALVWNQNPSWTNAQVREALQNSAHNLGPSGKDNTYGYGLVQAKAALDLLNGGSPPVNQPPTASFTDDCTDLTCIFDGSGSSDPEHSALTYQWSFGDGNTGSGATVSHTYGSAGTYTVALTVTDSGGLSDTASRGVSVTTAPPSGGFTLAATGFKDKGLQKANLTWSGASGANVDVYRGSNKVATVPNNGAYTDHINQRGGGSYTYKVCETGSMSTCSNEATVRF